MSLQYLLERIKQRPKTGEGEKQTIKPVLMPTADKRAQSRESASMPA
ncbi:MAG: hypothetical protein ACREHD_10155 [Pirellulales bacterium]